MCNASASAEINAEKRSTRVKQREAEREIEKERERERRREKETPRKTNCQRIRIKSLIAVRFAHYVRGMQDRTFPFPHFFLHAPEGMLCMRVIIKQSNLTLYKMCCCTHSYKH